MGKVVLVCGDRNWTNVRAIRTMMTRLLADGYTTVVEGGARGADRMAGDEARRLLFEVEVFPAHWENFGRAAGVRRNQQMLDEGKPDLVVFFHDDLEHSKGTKDMVQRALKHNIVVRDGARSGRLYPRPAMTRTIEERIAGFRQFCYKRRLTLLGDLNEISWRKAEEYLTAYLKNGAGELRHNTLIGMFKAWEAS